MPGSLDFGEGDVGESAALHEPTAARTPPAAILFDARTRMHRLNDNGLFEEIHPVDAAVVHCLHLARGKILSATATGVRYRELRSPYDKRAQATVEDMTMEALAGPISRGDIEVIKVTLRPRAYGEEIFVEYFNNRLTPRPRRNASSKL